MGYDKIPRQKLAITKKDKKWREACVEAFIDISRFGLSERKSFLFSDKSFKKGYVLANTKK